MSAAISLAAVALRCARLRTSLATTAKPRPSSPARAASTAAFSARMFVWNAIESMTPMISRMRLLESEISFIVTLVCSTHDHRLLQLCDRIFWVRDGVIDRVEKQADLKITTGSIGGEA